MALQALTRRSPREAARLFVNAAAMKESAQNRVAKHDIVTYNMRDMVPPCAGYRRVRAARGALFFGLCADLGTTYAVSRATWPQALRDPHCNLQRLCA